MKTIKILLATLLYAIMIYNVFALEKSYCDGFKSGYQDGWCNEIANCVRPVAPVCPVNLPNFDTHKDGYQRGFKQALKDRK